jgi:hypothetical protein
MKNSNFEQVVSKKIHNEKQLNKCLSAYSRALKHLFSLARTEQFKSFYLVA